MSHLDNVREGMAAMQPGLDLQAALARAYREDIERDAVRARLLAEAERQGLPRAMSWRLRAITLLALARAALEVLRGKPVEVIT